MIAVAKYTLCIIVGIAVEIVGLGLGIIATSPGDHSLPVPAGFAFVFPYAFILSPHDGASGFLAVVVIAITLLQMPIYGGLLAGEWVQHKFLRGVLIIGGIHFLAALIGFI